MLSVLRPVEWVHSLAADGGSGCVPRAPVVLDDRGDRALAPSDRAVRAHRCSGRAAASAILGTPQYMAPESIRTRDSADARTDIYAVGAVAYYLLAGVDVFDGKSVVEVCAQHLHEAPKPFSSRGIAVPAALEAIVFACLSKEPNDRPQSAAELRHRLDACGVEPWDSDSAQAWWTEYQSALDGDAFESLSLGRTIAVDGASRSANEFVPVV